MEIMQTKLLTPDDLIIKDRLARKAHFPMSEKIWRKKLELIGYGDWADTRFQNS